MNIGVTGVILIILIVLLLFGPSKLPKLVQSFGTMVRELKSSSKEPKEIEVERERKDP
ncbi:twin-arginine translocase TatA/TatE family subunit [Paenibacillus sp. HJGM_3]|uniref:twin-arginine translocase TatA/TatE family subunit n=1 Tax=Paenibacillus sp. HJGM_3 TaxID=3379816 RepID=UPI00385BFB2D